MPESWVELAFPTEANLREFLNDLQKRVDFFQKWITGSNNNEYWLKAFYLPQAFLTAIQLNFARTFAEVKYHMIDCIIIFICIYLFIIV